MSDESYTVNVMLKHPRAVMTEVLLAPGATTPKHSHKHDYIVHPKSDTTLTKTTYQGDQVIKTETVVHETGKPYFVAKSVDGTEFTLTNEGSVLSRSEKTQMPPGKA